MNSRNQWTRRRAVVSLASVIAVVGWIAASAGFESPPPDPHAAEGFSSLLTAQTRKTFDAVSGYLAQHPDAADAPRAYRWIFRTAREQGLERDAVPFAESYLRRDGDDSATRTAAQEVLALGLAQQGRLDGALAVFDDRLQSIRLRTPDETVDFAFSLAVQAQMAGAPEAARTIYGRVPQAFFLNTAVREMAESRLDKLELVGKPAPQIDVDDLGGDPVSLEKLAGRVVVVDFWATNCAPCLAEFPNMKQLYAEYHDRGLEILGISLDEDRDVVHAFQETWKLPWPLIVNPSKVDQLRRDYRVPKIPAIYVLDQQGTVFAFDTRGNDLRQAVERLLNRPPDPGTAQSSN